MRGLPDVLIFFFAMFAFLSPGFAAEAPYRLSPIPLEDLFSPDWLSEDSLLPARGSRMGNGLGADSPNSKVAVTDPLTRDLALPATTAGTAGAASQFRGLGRSADDTQIQALGIPLNPPQGGGFDFSSFPSFLWESYRFQLAPSRTAFDPRATSGVLVLSPWTRAALALGRASARATQGYSGEGEGVHSFSLGGSDGRHIGALLGATRGDSEGYSGSLSAKTEIGQIHRLEFHLLATDVEAKTRGSRTFPTPRGAQRTARGLPALQWTSKFSEARLIQAHAYADSQYIAYDSGSGFRSRDHGFALGGTVATDWDSFRAGVGLRNFRYSQLGQPVVEESLFQGHVSRLFILSSDWRVEPTVQASSVTGYGFLPAGSVSARFEPSTLVGWSFFANSSYSRKFPTVLDRVDVVPFSVGNPALLPERNLTLLAGGEWRGSTLRTELQGYLQQRQDAHILVTDPTTFVYRRENGGNASVRALLAQVEWDLSQRISFKGAGTWSGSELERTGGSFPYLPELQGSLFGEVHDAARTDWSLELGFRAQGDSQVTGPTDPFRGFTVWEAGGRYRLLERQRAGLDLTLFARMSDIFDQKPDPLKGYNGAGRVGVVGLTGSL